MAYTTIDDSSAHFQIATYTGNGSTQAITFDGNSDLQPDFIYGSLRDEDGGARFVFDSSRGTTKRLKTNDTTEEQVRSGVTAFSSDGFTMGDHADSNSSDETAVVWAWKANGGTTSSNTDGNVTVTLQANTTAGFSIGTWTSNGGTSGTIGHGLGARPDIVITKERDDTGNWNVIVPDYAGNEMGFLQSTAAFGVASGINTVGSSTFTDGDGADSNDRVFYAFRSIQGYSKIGFYKGNGNANGVFVYTGFQPRWLVIKPPSVVSNWFHLDTARDTYNPATKFLRFDGANVEDDGADKDIDFLSNGFKTRAATGFHNDNGETYLYIAFAKHPFVTSKGIPCTAF